MAADPDLVEIALERIKGATFEDFANAYFPSLLGVDYSPLGGMHDGGADAFGGDVVHERVGRTGTFYQASVQADPKAKIRQTVKRLREFDRDPKALTYLTSRVVPTIDVLEDDLSEELSVNIRIKDGGYIRAHVNDSTGTVAAYSKYLLPETAFLNSVGSAPVIGTSKHVSNPSVFVFLRQEVDKLDGDVSLVDSVTDSLVLWALEGTDPDAGTFMKEEEILHKILEQVPSAKSIVQKRLGKRLAALAGKDYPGGRQVNWHKQEDAFVLPFDTRRRITDENKADEALRLRVVRSFKSRVEAHFEDASDERTQLVAEVTLRSLQLAFEHEGLEFSHFVSRDEVVEFPKIGDSVRTAIAEFRIAGSDSVELAGACLLVARQCLYHSTEDERIYLGKLARTYTLLFTLSNEPRLVEYFEQMGSDFYLYVGSDMLVRALSERYLAAEDQAVRNVLLMAARSGARLVLTTPALEEVLHNIRTSDLEFRNHIEGVEHRLTRELMREVPKILLRAYLYNRDEMAGPSNWPAFVEQFCGYSKLFKPESVNQLRHYLQATFSMEFRTREELMNLTDPETVDSLTDDLMAMKGKRELAMNDALLACAVYGHRQTRRETSKVSEFGLKTWWLTNETKILQHTKKLETSNSGARYMMRPDFLLNFFAFAPRASEVRQSFANIFPSSLGVQLSRRMDETTFHEIMAKVRGAEDLEEGRRTAVIAECSDRLKADFDRRYRLELGDSD